MTREKRALKNLKQMCSDGRYLGSGSHAPLEVLEDFEVAIKALEQKSILDKIRAELHATAEMHEDGDYYLRDEWIDEYFDKYKAESEEV